ncbi:MAG TPA: HAD-IIIA family hydrolase [Gammaproteobacteria bacterium]|nr:HAD-IIIA family hydrolase [Gammaproteobacteria bacterium]
MDLNSIHARARKIRLAVFDVDGVLTDGSLYYGPDGETLKVFNVRDGYGIKSLQRAGIEVAIITGRNSKMTAARARDLAIEMLVQGREDKGVALDELLREHGAAPAEVAYMGDDVVDIPALEKVGLALTVQDAHPAVLRVAHWRASHPGGRGAVREACDMILAARAAGGA